VEGAIGVVGLPGLLADYAARGSKMILLTAIFDDRIRINEEE
jgi:hypothetical protein